MFKRLASLLVVTMVFAMVATVAFGQGTGVTGSITGAVTDPNGAVVAGATVVVKNNTTLIENTLTTSDNGTFTVPALSTGLYTVTITHAGFKQAVVTSMKVDVGSPSSINVTLEIGASTEIVTVVGGVELLQTQSATVGTTITGRQITDLPFASRNALDLVLFLPGVATVGRPRTSSVNGLPKGAVNITLDGVNVQDPLLKNSDGFFTYIQPKTDAIQEAEYIMEHGREPSGLHARLNKLAERMTDARTGFAAAYPEFEIDLATFLDSHDSIRSLMDETTSASAVASATRSCTLVDILRSRRPKKKAVPTERGTMASAVSVRRGWV